MLTKLFELGPARYFRGSGVRVCAIQGSSVCINAFTGRRPRQYISLPGRRKSPHTTTRQSDADESKARTYREYRRMTRPARKLKVSGHAS